MNRASIFGRIALGLVVVAAATVSPPLARAQDPAPQTPDAGTVLLSMMVTQCLEAEFKKLKTPCVVYVVGDAIQVDWLPEVEGVDAFLLSTSEATEGAHDGLQYYFFTEPERTRSGYEIGVGYGDGCNARGTTYAFRFRGKLLELKGPVGGFGRGCGSGAEAAGS